MVNKYEKYLYQSSSEKQIIYKIYINVYLYCIHA